jgi:hypothetical protein
MISERSLRFADEDELTASLAPLELTPEVRGDEPHVFVRTLAAPPGLPWDQARIADLEARQGAPLPLSEVMYQLKRLEAWRPGAPARFAAFYVLARQVDDRLEASAEVDGRPVEVTFVGRGEQGTRAAGVAMRGVVIAAVCLLFAWSVGAAFGKRAELDAALSLADQTAASKAKAVAARTLVRTQALLLAQEPDRGARLQNVLSDLAWADAAKSADARVEAVHWERGLLAIEARGGSPPVQATPERPVKRAAKPIRPGVWLWGVELGRTSAGEVKP